MSKYYGTLQGAKGGVSRCGTANSGLTTIAASWHGAIRVHLWDENGVTNFTVDAVPWHAIGSSRHLAHGALPLETEDAS